MPLLQLGGHGSPGIPLGFHCNLWLEVGVVRGREGGSSCDFWPKVEILALI